MRVCTGIGRGCGGIGFRVGGRSTTGGDVLKSLRIRERERERQNRIERVYREGLCASMSLDEWFVHMLQIHKATSWC